MALSSQPTLAEPVKLNQFDAIFFPPAGGIGLLNGKTASRFRQPAAFRINSLRASAAKGSAEPA